MIFALYSSPSWRKNCDGRAALHYLALHRQGVFYQAAHFRADAVEILGAESGRVGKIVVKTVFDHRTDGHLGLRETAA